MYQSVRLFMMAYLAAMIVLAGLAVKIFLNETNIIERQESFGEVINTSGAQHMLSQRLVLLADAMAEAETPGDRDKHRRALSAAVLQMQNSHERLTQGDLKWRQDSPNSENLAELYFGEEASLDEMVTEHIARARMILDANGASGMTWFPDEKLLPKLDATVSLYEADDRTVTEDMKKFSKQAFMAFGLVLLMLYAFVFWPIVNRLKDSEDELRAMANTDFFDRMRKSAWVCDLG